MAQLLFPTSVIGSLPRPQFVKDLIADDCPIQGDEYKRLMGNAIRAAVALQETAGLDVITDGEQTRLDFNLSFYGFLEGIALEAASPRKFGPPAHDQRGKHPITGELQAPRVRHEEALADRGFQSGQVAAQSCLGQVQLAGCGREGAGP